MLTDATLSIAVLNGYPRQSRENFDASDVGHPHDLYMQALRNYVPNAVFDVIFVADMDATLPTGTNLNSYDAVIWTGSDLTIYHSDDDRVTRQIELARVLFEAGVPMYGSCWGIQMAIVASGGEVKKNPNGREWSIARNIRQTDAGKQSLLLKNKPEVFNGFIMHLDEVTTLSPGATLLACNDHTHVQAVEVTHANGSFWATQYHPEYTLFEMARLIRARARPLVREGFFANTDDVRAYADKMFALAADTDNAALRAEFDVGADIIDDKLRQLELRNWLEYLVIPALGQRG
jgi:GMP synthase (glutamine-hydrolysing)